MKWYQSIMLFMTGFLNLSAKSEDQDVHDEMQSTLGKYGTLANMKVAMRTEIEADVRKEVQVEIDALKSGQAETQRLLDAAQKLNGEQATKITSLEADIVKLKAAPAAAHTQGDGSAAAGETAGGAGDDKVRPYMLNPIYLKAQSMKDTQPKD
jgi:hypothetical protein